MTAPFEVSRRAPAPAHQLDRLRELLARQLAEQDEALEEHDVAAIILEPIPHNIGAVLPQPGFDYRAVNESYNTGRRANARANRGDRRSNRGGKGRR